MVLAMILLSTSSNALAQMNLDTNTTTDITMFASSVANYQTYLPIVLREPGVILFPNGDFEQGPGIWEEYSKNGWELIVQEFSAGVTPYDGTWAVWLGGDYDEISYIQQQILVPVNSPYLSYWRWIISSDVCGFDFGRVLVNSNVVEEYDLCQANNTNGWVQKVIDLRAYAGQSVFIQIRAECNASINSNLFIDHVTFQSNLTGTNHPLEENIDIDESSLKQDVFGK
jgi:hypothetical protein